MSLRASRRARYGVPVAFVVGIAGASLAPALSGAAAPPHLPGASVRQLVTEAAQAAEAPAPSFSGELTWSANLGLSDLSSLEAELGASPAPGAGFDPLSLLSGDYHLKVWVEGNKAEHIALITGQTSEVDIVRNGGQIWLWDSASQDAVHLLVPSARVGPGLGAPAPAPSLPLPTPGQLAANLLSQLGGTTSLSVGSSVWVAGQPAYQLLVAPAAAPGSTVREVSIALGSKGELAGVPLQVAVYAKGVTSPVLEVGFSSITPGVPPASELSFVPPPGSHVVTRELPTGGPLLFGSPSGAHPLRVGRGWASVVEGTSSALASPGGQAALGPLTSPVEVAGKQARLFSTYLLNVLFMPGGRYYAGFVEPSVLEAAASRAP